MEPHIKKQLIQSVNNIKRKMKMIQNEEDAADLKFKKVFKSITDPLEALVKERQIKVVDKTSPTLNVSKTKNDTLWNIDSSEEYNNFQDELKAESSKSSVYHDLDTLDKKSQDDNPNKMENEQANDDDDDDDLNETLLSLGKEDVLNIYDNINVPFGIRRENKKLMMGNTAVVLNVVNEASQEKKYIITVNDKKYELTDGLKELLIRQKPNLSIVTEKDKITYKDLLNITNAHRLNFKPDERLKGDKGLKYRHIIKPLFSQLYDTKQTFPEQLKESKIGGYLPKLKKYKKSTDYIYWDDPNELIERLELLISSKNAGNCNHDNEIISIIEELKESGLIIT